MEVGKPLRKVDPLMLVHVWAVFFGGTAGARHWRLYALTEKLLQKSQHFSPVAITQGLTNPLRNQHLAMDRKPKTMITFGKIGQRTRDSGEAWDALVKPRGELIVNCHICRTRMMNLCSSSSGTQRRPQYGALQTSSADNSSNCDFYPVFRFIFKI